jgi:predicted DNA-binding protein (UPF0251 family)
MPKRWELVGQLRREGPMTIYALAQRLNRGYKNVHTDVKALETVSLSVVEIVRAVRELGLTQEEAGRRMGIPQPTVSALLRGDFANFS